MAQATATKTFEGRTAEEWKEMASASRRRSYESFDRCDTDGFMSQWASDCVAREYDLKAELAENGGTWTFVQLFDLDGNHVPAEIVEGNWGPVWRLFDQETHETTGWFNESSAQKPETRRANNAKKGFYIGTVSAPARVRSGGNAVSVSYFAVPADRYLPEFTVVDNGK
jgi:hypothetical protein